MTKEKNERSSMGRFLFSQYNPQIIILGIAIVVTGIRLLFSPFWSEHWMVISLVATGLAMLPLFNLWDGWIGYGWQVGIAPSMTFILMGIFIWFFGYDSVGTIWVDAVYNLFWTNLLILSFWLVFVVFLFLRQLHGEIWRDYRWVIAPAVLILLFLFDTSWAQSTLSLSNLKRSTINSTSLDVGLQLHAEYPAQILFDDLTGNEIHLWITGSLYRIKEEKLIIYSGQELLFAIKTESDKPLEWYAALPVVLTKDTKALTLLVMPIKRQNVNTQPVRLSLYDASKVLDTENWTTIVIESKHDWQVRKWKNGLLDTGGTVVSLIVAIFAGIKQLEEDKKRQRAERIKQAITTFDTDINNDISKIFKEHLGLVVDWDEWDRFLQDQFCDKYSLFVEKNLWDIVANKDISEIPIYLEHCLGICKAIFEGEEENPTSIIKRLLLIIENKDEGSLNAFINEHPESVSLIKQIAKLVSDKPLIIQVERIPRQEQIFSLSRPFDVNNKLSIWLEQRKLSASPFLDVHNAFTLLPRGTKMLIEGASTRFVFNDSVYSEKQLNFSTFWDLSAGLFEYIKQMPPKIKQNSFIVLLTPDMFLEYGEGPLHQLLFHALAESWFWEIIEDWSTYYSLTYSQRGLVGRLLCWHGNSSDSILSQFESRLGVQRHSSDTRKMSQQLVDWLKNTDSSDLLPGEMKSLVGLCPLSKQSVLLINSTAADIKLRDPSFFLNNQYLLNLKRMWNDVNFQISISVPRLVSTNDIIQQCNERVNLCSDNYLQGFDELFIPHGQEPAEKILAEKAAGSPGKMVRLGQKLFYQHVEKYLVDEDLHIEDLMTLE